MNAKVCNQKYHNRLIGSGYGKHKETITRKLLRLKNMEMIYNSF